MVANHRPFQGALLASAAALGLLAAAPAFAVTSADAIRTATAACLDSAGKQGWRTDLAKVISSRSLDADKVEVVFDLTRDGTNTARLTCPYSLSKGVAANFGSAAGNAATGAADAVGNAADAAANAVDTAAATATDAGASAAAAVNPGRAWWALLPLGLGLLGWAGLRGKDEGAAAYATATTGSSYAGSRTASGTAYAGGATTGTTTSRNIQVEANAQDGHLEVREHADIASAVLRRVHNGENLLLTGHRHHDWLQVASGGWVRDIDVRYDRNAVRFS